MSASTHYQCPTCQGATTNSNSRNLAVFIDGTSNKPGDKNTNVWKLSRQVESVEDSYGLKQPGPYYLKGIGAYDTDHLSPLDWAGTKIRSMIEMGFAWHAENNIKDAYTWLVDNYRRGDRIYLFGFSRGAYQVRALAAMIHEVGLVRDNVNVDVAYGHYLSIHPYNPEKGRKRMAFRKDLCHEGVRIHFVGVWDTVSSLGLIKRTVHITASATVTNACYFRHALALDERRVKFMPEYFTEVNAHRSNTKSQRSDVCDVKEVWFAGVHSDVGGVARKRDQVDDPSGHDDSESFPVHAGNVPLLWMRREAAANGLVFKPEGFTWDPEDVDDGREDSMTMMWKLLFEYLPVRHQVSFSGTGTHKLKSHLSHPRAVIPDQRIHSSILSGDVYAPRAALREGIHVPSGAQEASDNLWATELPDEEATMHLLASLLSNQQKTIESLERVLFILDSKLNNGLTQTITPPQWMEGSIQAQSDFDKFILTVVSDVISNFSALEESLKPARDSLCGLLTSRQDCSRCFYVLRFTTKHEPLRRHFITPDVIGALMSALEWTAKSPNKKLFPMVMDNLCNLINDDHSRGDVVNQLLPSPDERGTRQTRLSVALDMKAPGQLKAWLNLIISFAQYRADLCQELKPKIVELAKTEKRSVGWAAVEALVALNEPLNGDIHFSNVIGYLGNVLPPLDAEVGGAAPSDITGDLPAGLRVVGSGRLDEKVMHKLVSTIRSRNVHERTTATLTLLKLCRYPAIRNFCSQEKVVDDVFIKQLERKETSLLAAYALKTFLERGMPPSDLSHAARLIVGMLDKGWFDDAVGRIEGFDIFRGFMTFDGLRQQIMKLDIIPALMKKLEGGKRNEVRTSLICLDILGSYDSVELTSIVEGSISALKDDRTQTQTKAIKTLAALAKTTAGEQVISRHVIDIVRMLPESSGSPSQRSLGPVAALYDLSKNETLREQIRSSREFLDWKIRHQHHVQARGT